MAGASPQDMLALEESEAGAQFLQRKYPSEQGDSQLPRYTLSAEIARPDGTWLRETIQFAFQDSGDFPAATASALRTLLDNHQANNYRGIFVENAEGDAAKIVRHVSWIVKAPPTNAALVYPASLMVLMVFAFWPSVELAIRLSGLILQLSGVATAFAGLRDRIRGYEKDPTGRRFDAWWAERPWRLRHGTGSPSAALGNVTVSAAGVLGHGTTAATTVEGRLAEAERQIVALRKMVVEHAQSNSREFLAIKRSIEVERQKREEMQQQQARALELTFVGNVNQEANGLVWIFAGSVMSTMSADIAQWCTGLFK